MLTSSAQNICIFVTSEFILNPPIESIALEARRAALTYIKNFESSQYTMKFDWTLKVNRNLTGILDECVQEVDEPVEQFGELETMNANAVKSDDMKIDDVAASPGSLREIKEEELSNQPKIDTNASEDGVSELSGALNKLKLEE